MSCSGSLDAVPEATTIYKPFAVASVWSLTKTLSPVTNATPSSVSPFWRSAVKSIFPVVAASAIILVLNPATASSTYVVAALVSICVWIAEDTPLR